MSSRRVLSLTLLSLLLVWAPAARAQAVPSEDALYQRAVALQAQGQSDQAIQALTELVRTYPDSARLDWAYYEIGEYWFAHNAAFKALNAYTRVAWFTGSTYRLPASYKSAWCFYNLGEYERAISTLEAIVAPGIASYTLPEQRQVAELALQDLVRFYADAGDMARAERTFRAQGRLDLLTQAMVRLAKTSEETGRSEVALLTWKRLIELDPSSPEVASYQAEIARIRARMK